MENLNLLQAMLLIARNLTYSDSYKMELMNELYAMIAHEECNIEYYRNKYSPIDDSVISSLDCWDGDESDKFLQ